MRKPNFFIVGAPKSGTTSLFHYLDQHPDIYIPSIKEPRFFIADDILATSDDDPIKEYLLRTSTLNQQEYLDLYKNSSNKILGDASIQYLYHYETVIPKMLKLVGKDVKILIVLRNPVDRAFSNYSHNLSTYENLDFEQALASESDRILNGFNSFWHYKGHSMYGKQVEAFFQNFDNVKLVFFEDFISDIENTVKDIYTFLDVDSSFTTSDYLVNKKNTGQAKSKLFNQFMVNVKKIKGVKKIAYSIFGERRVKHFNELILRANLSKKKVKLDVKLRDQLNQFFKQDVEYLKKVVPNQKIDWFK